MSVDSLPAEDTLGVLLPDDMVEKLGLKPGDVFDVSDTGQAIALRPVDEILAARFAASPDRTQYKIVVRDLAKLAAE